MQNTLLILALDLLVASAGCGSGSHALLDAGLDHTPDGQLPCGTADTVQVSTGAQYSCARLTDGTLRCWGGDFQAQLGDGVMQHQMCSTGPESFDCSPRPVTVAGIFDATGISAGELDTACAVRANGNVVCWGLNAAGEVGVEPPTREYSPVTVPTLADATAVAVGAQHSCALSSEGRVACWGANKFGQLGGGQVDQDPHPSPVTAVGLTSATAIAAGGGSACALLADASVVCWGEGDFGEIGDGGMTMAVGTPTSVMGLDNAIAITLGARHACAVRDDGTVWCWGANDAGQIGDGTGVNALTPVQVAGLTAIVAIAAGGLHTCAQDSSGRVWCWGSVNENQLPSAGTSGDNLIPVTQISELAGTGSMGPSLQHDCFVASDASVRCGGRDDSGELGNGSVQPSGALTTVCW